MAVDPKKLLYLYCITIGEGGIYVLGKITAFFYVCILD